MDDKSDAGDANRSPNQDGSNAHYHPPVLVIGEPPDQRQYDEHGAFTPGALIAHDLVELDSPIAPAAAADGPDRALCGASVSPGR
jgi:hypothetical protein